MLSSFLSSSSSSSLASAAATAASSLSDSVSVVQNVVGQTKVPRLEALGRLNRRDITRFEGLHQSPERFNETVLGGSRRL
eukprot:638384-Rhodomonas_salina.2